MILSIIYVPIAMDEIRLHIRILSLMFLLLKFLKQVAVFFDREVVRGLKRRSRRNCGRGGRVARRGRASTRARVGRVDGVAWRAYLPEIRSRAIT